MLIEKGANLEATFQPENNTIFLLASEYRIDLV